MSKEDLSTPCQQKVYLHSFRWNGIWRRWHLGPQVWTVPFLLPRGPSPGADHRQELSLRSSARPFPWKRTPLCPATYCPRSTSPHAVPRPSAPPCRDGVAALGQDAPTRPRCWAAAPTTRGKGASMNYAACDVSHTQT